MEDVFWETGWENLKGCFLAIFCFSFVDSRRKKGKKKKGKSCMQALLILSFACLQEFDFPKRSKKKRKKGKRTKT